MYLPLIFRYSFLSDGSHLGDKGTRRGGVRRERLGVREAVTSTWYKHLVLDVHDHVGALGVQLVTTFPGRRRVARAQE